MKTFIISRTFSKAMGLGGIRLGYLIAHPEVIGYIDRIRVPENTNVLTQTTALAALEDIAYINTNVKRVIATRRMVPGRNRQDSGNQGIPVAGQFCPYERGRNGKPAERFVTHIRNNGYLVRNLSGGRNLAGKGFFRATVGTGKICRQWQS